MLVAGPTYPLRDIKRKVSSGSWYVTATGLAGATALGFDVFDVQACVQGLSEDDFHKTMPSDKQPGLMQDVYKTRYLNIPIYLKVQENRGASAVVISFKEDESPKKGGP